MSGIVDAISKRLSVASFGKGIDSTTFLTSFKGVSPPHARSVETLCKRFEVLGLISSHEWTIGRSGRVYVKVNRHQSLAAAASVAHYDMAVYIQKYCRGLLDRIRFAQMMNDFIEQRLEETMDNVDRIGLENAIGMARRWGMGQALLPIALSKLDRMKKEQTIKDDLARACEKRDLMLIYDALAQAATLGLTDEYEFIREARAMQRQLEEETAKLAEENRPAFKGKFANVVRQLSAPNEDEDDEDENDDEPTIEQGIDEDAQQINVEDRIIHEGGDEEATQDIQDEDEETPQDVQEEEEDDDDDDEDEDEDEDEETEQDIQEPEEEPQQERYETMLEDGGAEIDEESRVAKHVNQDTGVNESGKRSKSIEDRIVDE